MNQLIPEFNGMSTHLAGSFNPALKYDEEALFRCCSVMSSLYVPNQITLQDVKVYMKCLKMVNSYFVLKESFRLNAPDTLVRWGYRDTAKIPTEILRGILCDLHAAGDQRRNIIQTYVHLKWLPSNGMKNLLTPPDYEIFLEQNPGARSDG